MRYNAKSLEINVVISGNVLLFKDIKISLGLLITAREMHALFWENHFLEVSTTGEGPFGLKNRRRKKSRQDKQKQ